MKELQDNFGPHNPQGKAQDELNALQMGEHDWFLKYITYFNNLASRTGLNDTALASALYRGLPARLKDELA